jgi:methylmalonyl-CoA mutase cobalamin-binding domain/chain
MKSDSLERLKKSLLDLNMEAAVAQVRSIINGEGVSSVREAVDAVSDALQVVGRRFQDGEWFLAELVYAGEIAKEVMALLSPLLPVGASQRSGTVIVGTVAGDLHDLGKNIFVNYARSAGFEVIDLGVDVSKEKFASAVSEHDPLVLGISCLLTVTSGEIENVIEELKSQGRRDKIKVIVGGAALTAQFARDVGADAFAADAVTGTDIIKEWAAA